MAELLAHGPSLTAQPEAVSPESWADLLAAGKGTGAAAAGGAATPPPATARRLSNPVQEASNFAAEGMAADADVLTVHGVLVQRLAAAGAALQAASSQSGAAGGGTDLRAALAEAAVCRGEHGPIMWLMLCSTSGFLQYTKIRMPQCNERPTSLAVTLGLQKA